MERSSTVAVLEMYLALAASKVTSWAVASCSHGTTSWMKVRAEASADGWSVGGVHLLSAHHGSAWSEVQHLPDRSRGRLRRTSPLTPALLNGLHHPQKDLDETQVPLTFTARIDKVRRGQLIASWEPEQHESQRCNKGLGQKQTPTSTKTESEDSAGSSKQSSQTLRRPAGGGPSQF